MIAARYSAPAYVELDAEMTATGITIAKMRSKTREDWMIAEQNLKQVIMDSVELTMRHIITPPPLAFQSMPPIDIINAVRDHYGKFKTWTARRLEEILAEKLVNVAEKFDKGCRMTSLLPPQRAYLWTSSLGANC